MKNSNNAIFRQHNTSTVTRNSNNIIFGREHNFKITCI